MRKKSQTLNDKEKDELVMLNNPNVKFFSSSSAPIISRFLGSGHQNLSKRKERVVELKTKLRINELGLNPNKDWQEYYRIREEEERLFDERFKNC